jgi:hypothetical protein
MRLKGCAAISGRATRTLRAPGQEQLELHPGEIAEPPGPVIAPREEAAAGDRASHLRLSFDWGI